MNEFFLTEEEKGVSDEQLAEQLDKLLAERPEAKKILIIPPDYTRCYSYAGVITQMLYEKLSTRTDVQIDVMPALGTHMPMNEEEMQAFFGQVVPRENILIHHWQTDTVKLGSVPAETCSAISGGKFPEAIDVEVNHLLVDGGYDLILSVGQVVPHEVVGMANYSKNLFVGVGGREMINKSHMLSAICGMEKALGVTDSPARQLYDYAQQHYIDGKIPVVYIQTVTTAVGDKVKLHGVYMGTRADPLKKQQSWRRNSILSMWSVALKRLSPI